MDASEKALKAVQYAAVIIAGKIQQANIQITLFHVLYKAPYEEIEKSQICPIMIYYSPESPLYHPVMSTRKK